MERARAITLRIVRVWLLVPVFLSASAAWAQTPTIQVEAGGPYQVDSGASVQLNGSHQIQNSAGDTSVAWSKVGGTGGRLAGSRSLSPVYVARTLEAGASNQLIVVRLTVTDGGVSAHDDAEITVLAPKAPPPAPEPKPDPEPPTPEPTPPEPEPVCPHRLAPYWHGTGGFAVRPTDGESATVRIECAGRRYTSREYAGEDGLIVRTVSQPTCTAEDGRPFEGEMAFEGIDGDGWYWVNGDRNVAVAPLVCEESLHPELRPPVPDGVTARPSGDRRFVLSVRGTWHGTLMLHDETGFMGIVPHLVDLEGDGAHVAPYWKGGGGIVGRPLDGSRATVRLACGEADAGSQVLDADEDGLIVELLPGCFDEDGAAVSGRLEVDGLEDGAWYWLNTGTAAAAAPLLRRGVDVDLTVPVLPAGVNADEGPLGTLLSRGPLLGVVPRVERVEN